MPIITSPCLGEASRFSIRVISTSKKSEHFHFSYRPDNGDFPPRNSSAVHVHRYAERLNVIKMAKVKTLPTQKPEPIDNIAKPVFTYLAQSLHLFY